MSKEICYDEGAIVVVVSVSSLKFAMLFSWLFVGGGSPFLIVGFFVPPKKHGNG